MQCWNVRLSKNVSSCINESFFEIKECKKFSFETLSMPKKKRLDSSFIFSRRPLSRTRRQRELKNFSFVYCIFIRVKKRERGREDKFFLWRICVRFFSRKKRRKMNCHCRHNIAKNVSFPWHVGMCVIEWVPRNFLYLHSIRT